MRRAGSILPTLLLLAAGARAQGPLEGHWAGTWVREGSQLAVQVEFARSGEGYAGSFDSEQLRVIGIPFRAVTYRPPVVTWQLVGDFTTTLFAGELHAGVIAGTFHEGEAVGTFSLTRAGAPPAVRPHEEEIVFESGGATLSGSILLPAAEGPLPGVVLLHGSGAQGRAGSRFLATWLAERGMAALIWDKRGVGASGGDWRTATFEDLAGDAASAVETLRRHPRVAPDRVGIHGHSQGATYAPLVAARLPDLAFIVAEAASGLPMDELEVFSVENALGVEGLPAEEAQLARELVRALVAVAYRGAPRQELVAAWERVRDRPWAFEPPPEDDPYWSVARAIGTFDPLPAWEAVTAPVLLAYGGADARVPARRSAAAIASALLGGRAAARGGGLTVLVFEDADHTFRVPPAAGRGFSWPQSAAGYPDRVVDWILGAATADPARR